jgi:hypothetical protein
MAAAFCGHADNDRTSRPNAAPLLPGAMAAAVCGHAGDGLTNRPKRADSRRNAPIRSNSLRFAPIGAGSRRFGRNHFSAKLDISWTYRFSPLGRAVFKAPAVPLYELTG